MNQFRRWVAENHENLKRFSMADWPQACDWLEDDPVNNRDGFIKWVQEQYAMLRQRLTAIQGEVGDLNAIDQSLNHIPSPRGHYNFLMSLATPKTQAVMEEFANNAADMWQRLHRMGMANPRSKPVYYHVGKSRFGHETLSIEFTDGTISFYVYNSGSTEGLHMQVHVGYVQASGNHTSNIPLTSELRKIWNAIQRGDESPVELLDYFIEHHADNRATRLFVKHLQDMYDHAGKFSRSRGNWDQKAWKFFKP